jgi:two-component system nitrate/nitrite response regulator NarL
MFSVVSGMIVSDRNLFREGLALILHRDRREYFEITEAESFVTARNVLKIGQTPIDFIIGDLGADTAGELAAVKSIRQQFPDIRIVILTYNLSGSHSELVLESGAIGWLSENISAAGLKQSLDLIMTDQLRTPTGAAQVPVPWPTPGDSDPGDSAVEFPIPLTVRETQILSCLVNGLPNKLIARELNMAEATVKVHLRSLLRKIQARNRTQAAIWALRVAPSDQYTTDFDPLRISEMTHSVKLNATRDRTVL